MKKGLIYCLKDPFTDEIRYVGFTCTSINNRFSQHKYEALKKNVFSHKNNWFRECFEKGLLPKIELLEDNIPFELWEEKENYYINQYNNLTNQRKGGCGIVIDRDTSSIERSIKDKKRKVVQLDLNGNYIQTYESIRDAERSLNSGISRIRAVCQNKAISALGFKWCYEDNYNLGIIPDYTDQRKIRHNQKAVKLYLVETNELLGEFISKAQALQSINEKPDCYIRKDGTIKGLYRLEEIKI